MKIENEKDLLGFLKNLEFPKVEFSTYDYSKCELNKEESLFYFFHEILAYIPMKNKNLSKRLELISNSSSIDIILDNLRIGSLNYYQHSCYVEDYPNHWFKVKDRKDIGYVLQVLAKYSLKNGLKIDNLPETLERKIIHKYSRSR